MRVVARPWILYWALGVHTGLAAALLANAEEVTQFSVIIGLNIYTDWIAEWIFAIILIVVSLLALVGLIQETTLRRSTIIILIFGQYFLVMSAMLSTSWIIATREFGGQQFSFWVVFAVLWPTLWATLLHTLAILDRYFHLWNK